MPVVGYYAWNLTGRGERPCVRDDTTELSYAQFAARVDAAAAQFERL